jgi:hypothetical protein
MTLVKRLIAVIIIVNDLVMDVIQLSESLDVMIVDENW